MPSCAEQYFADVAACDAQFNIDKAACAGDPSCLQLAISKRQACEQTAYLKYIQCIGSQGGGGGTNFTGGGEGSQLASDGAPDCGCG